MSFKNTTLIFLSLFLVVNCNTIQSRQSRFLPIFGWFFGPRCDICPPVFCEDHPAVVLGYCCGCRPPYQQEFLPIECSPPPLLNCPLDGENLCLQYEQMIECCCS